MRQPYLKAFRFRVNQLRRHAEVQVRQGPRLIHRQKFQTLRPNQSAKLAGNWLSEVDPAAGVVQISLI